MLGDPTPILLDGLPEGFRVEVALRRLPPGDPGRPALSLRLAWLIRVLDPERAITLADEAEAAGGNAVVCAAIRAACLLERAQPAEAAPWIAALPGGPHKDLLEARRALLAEGPDVALPELHRLASNPTLPPSVRAEALSFRLRARAATGDDRAMEDLDALEQLCIEQNATLTGIWVGALKGILRSEQMADLSRMLGAWEVASLVAHAVKGVEMDQEKLGAVPPWVHGVLVKYRNEPDRIAAYLIPMAALMWRIDRQLDAFTTVVLGAEVVRRVAGDEAAAAIEEFGETLRARAGEPRWQELMDELLRSSSGDAPV